MDQETLPNPISLMSLGPAVHHPIVILETWLTAARRLIGPLASAMSLATVDSTGHPDVRIVLMQSIRPDGLVFFTNLQSPKGRHLAANNSAALCFHWPSLGRQVRVRGAANSIDSETADAYFVSRPRGAQVGAHASPQSRSITDRTVLLRMVDQEEERFRDRDVPRPAHWGGFVIQPSALEFWEDGSDRLHDRMLFSLVGGHWTAERLAP